MQCPLRHRKTKELPHALGLIALLIIPLCGFLQDNWSPAFTISKVLLSIQTLLVHCNPGEETVALTALLIAEPSCLVWQTRVR